MSSKTTSSCGISIFTLLTVAFVVLKLCGIIDWSWWWVLAPLWMPWALVAIIGAVILVGATALKVIARIIDLQGAES